MSRLGNNFYVYGHYALDTDELFYIGKGIGNRYISKHGRSEYWNRIVNKHGYKGVIFKDGLKETEAFEKEILAIKKHQPRANFTAGGSGGNTGPNSGNFTKNHIPWNKGLKCPDISERQVGNKNHMYGKKSVRRRSIVCQNDQKIFNCISDAASFYNISRRHLSDHLRGRLDHVSYNIFQYINDGCSNISALKKRLKRKYNQKQPKRIKCIETNQVFSSIGKCAKYFNIHPSNICKVLKKQRKSTNKCRFEYV